MAGQSSTPPHVLVLPKPPEILSGTRGNITKALDGINLSVARGEFTIAIMGPSGFCVLLRQKAALAGVYTLVSLH